MIKQLVVDGVCHPIHTPLLCASDRGFLIGHTCFETLRVVSGQLLFWSAHQQRLADGCAQLGLMCDTDNLYAYCQQCIEANHLQDSTHGIRITISAKPTARGLWPQQQYASHCIVQAFTLPAPEPIVACLQPTVTALSPASHGLKTNNYQNQLLALANARQQGCNEAILCDAHGALSEATAANIFLIEQNTLLTPKEDGMLLPGIMRRWVIDTARNHDIPIREQTITPTQLTDVHSIWLCNSLQLLKPIARINGYTTCLANHHPIITQLYQQL